jgi:hypothetical protein
VRSSKISSSGGRSIEGDIAEFTRRPVVKAVLLSKMKAYPVGSHPPALRLLPSFLSKLSLATRSAIKGVTPSSAKATAPRNEFVSDSACRAACGKRQVLSILYERSLRRTTPAMNEGEDGRCPFRVLHSQPSADKRTPPYAELRALGCWTTTCIDPRRVPGLTEIVLYPSDRNNARAIVQVMRAGWYSIVYIKSGVSQELRMLLDNWKTLLSRPTPIGQLVVGRTADDDLTGGRAGWGFRPAQPRTRTRRPRLAPPFPGRRGGVLRHSPLECCDTRLLSVATFARADL